LDFFFLQVRDKRQAREQSRAERKRNERRGIKVPGKKWKGKVMAFLMK
jgi:hypothetical protein